MLKVYLNYLFKNLLLYLNNLKKSKWNQAIAIKKLKKLIERVYTKSDRYISLFPLIGIVIFNYNQFFGSLLMSLS